MLRGASIERSGSILAGSGLIPRDEIMKPRYLTDEIYEFTFLYAEPKTPPADDSTQYPNIVRRIPFGYTNEV